MHKSHWNYYIAGIILSCSMLPLTGNASANNFMLAQSTNANQAATSKTANQFLNEFYALQKTDQQKAHQLLTQMLQHYPNNLTALKEQGYYFINTKQLEKALATFQKVYRLDPKDEQSGLQIAYILQDLKRYQPASKLLKTLSRSSNKDIKQRALAALKVIDELPAETKASYYLSLYLQLKSNNPHQAQTWLNKAYQLNPNDPAILLQMGILRTDQDQLLAAEKLFQKALNYDPNNKQALNLLLNTKQKLGEKVTAQQLQHKAQQAKTKQLREQAQHALTLTAEKERQQAEQAAAQLLTKYYALKQLNPKKAIQLLLEINDKYPNNLQTQLELGYFYIEQKQLKKALTHFKNAQRIKPENLTVQLQIAYLHQQLDQNQQAKQLFQKLAKSENSDIKRKAQEALKAFQSQESQSTATTNTLENMLNEYYSLKKTNKAKSLRLLQKIVARYPKSVEAQKELGYRYMALKETRKAIPHFLAVIKLKLDDYPILEQLGFNYQEIKDYKSAYYYFKRASHSPNSKISQRSRDTLIYLQAQKNKWLPDPWYVDFYASPLYTVRFGAYVFPVEMRFGRYFGKHKQFSLYVRLRYTLDSKSLGGIRPDIFDDNALILSVGGSVQPFRKIPAIIYVEYGAAYDLIPRNRPRWRPDFRGGIVYFQRWGAPPVYAPNFRFVLKPVVDAYGDFSYFTRFDDNWIGNARIRAGFRVIEFKYSSIGIYAKAEYIFDTRHEFYNNIIAPGFGVVIRPFSPLNLDFRIEHNYGYYIPVNSPSPNPFGPRFQNTVLFVEFYAQL